MSEQWWTTEDEERVAAAMCKADTVSWKNDIENGTTTLEDSEWNDMGDETVLVPYEGISLGRDHYRTLARAALAAMPVPLDNLIERLASTPWITFMIARDMGTTYVVIDGKSVANATHLDDAISAALAKEGAE